MSDCHWCENLQEPHETHALAKGYVDLVCEAAIARTRQHHAERRLHEYQQGIGPLIAQNGGLALRLVIDPLGDIVARRRAICALFEANYPREWTREERRWWREWKQEIQHARS